MIDQEKIGGFLRDLRKEKGQTQEELAEKFGVFVFLWAQCLYAHRQRKWVRLLKG